MDVFFCDHFELPLPDGHRFPIQKYSLAREKVRGLYSNKLHFRVADAASREVLELVHDKDYLDRVFSGTLSELEQKRIGFPWSAKMLERCRRSTGSTIAASKSCLRDGLAIHLSGGTHHAFADQGQGFCVFNDIAVACAALLQSGKIERATIIDLDVHQGNGTASIFRNDERVFTFSVHGDKNFPFCKTEGDLDLALPDGTTDEEYLHFLKHSLDDLPLHKSDVVFYLAGADPYEKDRMGRLKLTRQGLARRDAMVVEACRARDIPLTIVLGGGYADIVDVAEIHAATVGIALQYFRARS